MGCLGNFLWFVFGGFFQGLGWTLAGIFWCITIVGIPIGTQCFKFAKLSFFPFGKEVIYGGGAGSVLLNILWLILSGIPLAIVATVLGNKLQKKISREKFLKLTYVLLLFIGVVLLVTS